MYLGFYYHISAVQKGGKIWMPGYLGCFLDSLAEHFEGLVLFQHLPNPGENINLDYSLKSLNVKLVSLPPRGSVPNRTFRPGRYTRILKEHLSPLGALMVRAPTPLLPAMIRTAGSKPTILLIVGDYLAGVDSLPQPWWRKNLIRLWAWNNSKKQLNAARKSLVFVNNFHLYQMLNEKIKNLEETRTTTLSQEDFYIREDTCQERPIHLLYTGRMDPAKGLLDMVDALGILVREGEDLILDLVGWAEEGSDILSLIDISATKYNINDRIIYHGYKTVGQELFAYYKQADIYVIASQSSFEGFPRTIWEAMAHSLPVVATQVGSIPDFIEHAAVLVPPKDPQALAYGVRRLIQDSELRQSNIQAGFSLAQQNTLEVQVPQMVQIIKDWLQ